VAYDWPPGWNDSHLERALQHWICERLDVPKYAVRVSIDSDGGTIGPEVDIFKPIGEKPTEAVLEVMARVAQFGKPEVAIGLPLEKTGERTWRLSYSWVLHTDSTGARSLTPTVSASTSSARA
jgi:hypothetical protein